LPPRCLPTEALALGLAALPDVEAELCTKGGGEKEEEEEIYGA
jgi:hypothetical protein